MSQVTVLLELAEERNRQDKKFGDQTHLRDRVSDAELAIYMEERTFYQRECQDHYATPEGSTWTDILLEEAFEAVSEQNPAKLREELVQVGAVVVAWIEALDKRAGRS